MKFIPLLFFISLFLDSCSSVKKAVTTKLIGQDSIGVKFTTATNTMKIDSVSVEDSKLAVTRQSENDYTKTTVIKEYYAEEFAFTTKDRSTQDNIEVRKVPDREKQLIKETTIFETGKLTVKTDEKYENTEKSRTRTIDSTGNQFSEISKVKKHSEQTETNTTKVKAFSGWLLFSIIGLILLLIFLFYKRK